MRNNGDVRCSDCEHFSLDGCEEASEALAQDGWPRAAVIPEDDADASRCPEFLAGPTLALNLDEERSVRSEHLRAETLRACGVW
jgi:hypothetical protein